MHAKQKQIELRFHSTLPKSLFRPRYWGIWLGIGLMAGISLVPARLRDPLLGTIGTLAGKLAAGARRRARINLLYCLPNASGSEREHIIDAMFACAP